MWGDLGAFFAISRILQPAKIDSSEFLSYMVFVLHSPTFSFNGHSNARGEIMYHNAWHLSIIKSFAQDYTDLAPQNFYRYTVTHQDVSELFVKKSVMWFQKKYEEFFWSCLMFSWWLNLVWKMSCLVNFPCQSPGCSTAISFILVYLSMWKSLPVIRSVTVIVAYFINCYHFLHLYSLTFWL